MDRGVKRTPKAAEERWRSGRIPRNLCFKSGVGKMRVEGGSGRGPAKAFSLARPSP